MTTRRRREQMILSMLIVVMLLLTTAMISTSPVQDNEGKEELDGGDEMVVINYKNIKGNITTLNANGSTLIDANALFKTGRIKPQVGWGIRNLDDVSWGIIASIDTDIQITLLEHTGGATYLQDGTGDDWDKDDKYELFETGFTYGTVTSAHAGTQLTDSTARFITGPSPVRVGALVVNVDDVSFATVLSIDSDTQITHTALGGGGSNDWVNTERYELYWSDKIEVTQMRDTQSTFNYGATSGLLVGYDTTNIYRMLVRITLPENPVPQEENLEITKLSLLFSAKMNTGTSMTLQANLLNHNLWILGSQNAAIHTNDTPNSSCWDKYGHNINWQGGGASSDFDNTTNWNNIGDGVIGETGVSGAGYTDYSLDLTPLISSGGYTWGDEISVRLISSSEVVDGQIDFPSTGQVPQYAPRIVIKFRDLAPEQPTIRTRSLDDRNNPTYGEIIVEERPSDADLQVYNAAWKLTSPVLYSDDNKRTQPFSDVGKESYPLQDLASFAFLEDTEYFDRFFAEDNNNVGEYGTGGNEVRRFRDGLSIRRIVNEDGASGASLEIGEQVFIVAIPTTPGNDIAETHIWWGDGSEATYPYWYAVASLNSDAGGSTQTITVPTTAGINIGDYLAFFTTDGATWWEAAKVISKTATVVTVEFEGTSGIAANTITHVVRTRTHRYRSSAETTAYLQIKNSDGWLSDKTAVTDSPVPAAVNPTAIIHPSKRTCLVDESIYLDGNSSFTTDLSDTLAWNGAVARWSKTAGPGTATFSDTDAQITGVSFDTAGTYTIQLAIVTTTGGDTGTTTIDITVADENYFTYPSPDPERAIMSQLEKQSTPSPVLDTIAGGKGFDLSKKTYGGFTIPLEGIVTRVGDKNKLEGLVDGTYQYMKYNIDGTVRDLYLLRLGITETSGRFIPTTQPASGDADFYTSTTYGIWEWSGLFFYFTGV